ncbi:S-norcoclaurine synthase [Melia azedarach]|uniref:S-norcoclaurine synthase n=2 Tax=Melia azedarach TaxID=155640 RepID=A0ACC1YBF9_MELAZ|nr:S-norcoclaurine synthase [Melia azedarach]KAJ4721086.1 S-norcoclaurine synthase [Melia azedarach]
MKGQVTKDTVVEVPANTMWDVYGCLELGRLVDLLLPDVIGRIEILEGDGSVGTLVKVTFPPGTPGAGYMKERFTKIDDVKRLKETELVEGGYIDVGFDACRIRMEIIEKDDKSSVVRTTIEYEIDDKLADLSSQITTKPLEIMAKTIGKYLSEKKA